VLLNNRWRILRALVFVAMSQHISVAFATLFSVAISSRRNTSATVATGHACPQTKFLP